MMESRKNFYADEMNYERMEKKLEEVAQDLTLAEVLKMVREICYDMVYYNGENNCGVIYKDKKYSKKNIEQACQLQRLVSTACDLFGQSIINHREFDDGYLNKWLNGGAMELQIESLKNEIDSLNELENRDDVLEEFEDWLERQKTRNSEWDNFIMVDGRLGIPISYLLNKLQELKRGGKE